MYCNVEFGREEMGGRQYITYSVSHNDIADNVEMRMLKENSVEGLLEYNDSRYDEQIVLRYDVTGKQSLEEYLGNVISKADFNTYVKSMLNALEESGYYMIDNEHIVLDIHNVYVDINTGKCGLVLLPCTETDNVRHITWREFLNKVIEGIKYETNEDVLYLNRLRDMLSDEKNGIKELIGGLSEDRSVEKKTGGNNVNDIQVNNNAKFVINNEYEQLNAIKMQQAEQQLQKAQLLQKRARQIDQIAQKSIKQAELQMQQMKNQSQPVQQNMEPVQPQQQPYMNMQPPVQQMPVQQPPVQQMPVQQPPVQQMPVQQPPVQQPPIQQPPIQQPPVMPPLPDNNNKKLSGLFSKKTKEPKQPKPEKKKREKKVKNDKSLPKAGVFGNIPGSSPKPISVPHNDNPAGIGSVLGGAVSKKTAPGTGVQKVEKTVMEDDMTFEPYIVEMSSKNRIPISKTEFRIGRKPELNDYTIQDSKVSGEHVIISLDYEERRAYIRDVGSSNGTYVDGNMITKNINCRLEQGTRFRLGKNGEEYIFMEQ